MKLYNTLTGLAEEIDLSQKKINIYLCGVTVYDECHIGHARTIIIFDVFKNRFRDFWMNALGVIHDLGNMKIHSDTGEWEGLVRAGPAGNFIDVGDGFIYGLLHGVFQIRVQAIGDVMGGGFSPRHF